MKIDIEKLLECAKAETGLSDFGNDYFMEGLEQLVAGLNGRDDTREGAIESLQEHIIMRPLLNLLYCAKDIAEHPEIVEETLLPPVTIVSMPRAGTTKLQRILSATNAFQDIAFWQIHMPSRIPGLPDGGREQRRDETRRFLEWRMGVTPDTNKGHPVSVDGADEEIFIIENIFRSVLMWAQHNADSYVAWTKQADMAPSYDYLYQQLQYLQWQFYRDNRKSYLLKAPAHLGFEDQLARIFPQGKIIFPHRNPIDQVASTCYVMELAWEHFYDIPDAKKNTGEFILDWLSRPLQRHLAWRDSNPDTEVLDMSFNDTNNDSVAAAEKVYDFIGQELTDETVQKIRQWDADNPRYAHGKSDYSLEKYGLTQARVEEAFAPYLERFSQYM